MEQFIMNNCKIANELRKYRDLTGCVNRVSLSDDPENYADYVITQELSYLDMVTANAVYSLWRSGEGEGSSYFQEPEGAALAQPARIRELRERFAAWPVQYHDGFHQKARRLRG